MSYYRPRWAGTVWGVAIALALLAALCWAGALTLSATRADERRVVLAEGNVLLTQALQRGDTLQRSLDSLSAIVRHRDTLLIVRIEQAKGESVKPIPPASDTAALVAVVRSCRATLDTLASDCAAFREVATTALAKADTTRRGDSTVIAGLSLQLAGIRRADSLKAAQSARAGKWRVIERGVCAGSVAANVFQWSGK